MSRPQVTTIDVQSRMGIRKTDWPFFVKIKTTDRFFCYQIASLQIFGFELFQQ